MLYFLGCVGLLIAGYFVYGGIVDRIFGPDPNRPTPATTHADGIDYVEMKPLKIFLVQLLNIAGPRPAKMKISPSPTAKFRSRSSAGFTKGFGDWVLRTMATHSDAARTQA